MVAMTRKALLYICKYSPVTILNLENRFICCCFFTESEMRRLNEKIPFISVYHSISTEAETGCSSLKVEL